MPTVRRSRRASRGYFVNRFAKRTPWDAVYKREVEAPAETSATILSKTADNRKH